MTRQQTKVRIGGVERYRVTITDDPHPPTGTHQLTFLQELATNGVQAGFLACGLEQFQTMHVAHNGTAWTAVMEAEVPE